MKKTLFFLLLFTGMVKAQIVTIPDAEFKTLLLSASVTNEIASDALGNSIKIDANNDGEIQNSEALKVFGLNVSYTTIIDVTGITSFTNLNTFTCEGNSNITTLNLQGLVNLTYLNCSSNLLTSLDVTSLVNLTTLKCSNNKLASLDVTPLVKLSYLACFQNQLTSLDINPLLNITYLDCQKNKLSSLDVTPLVKLTYLNCSSNQLALLDVSPLVKLSIFGCSENQLTTINVKPLIKLTGFSCSSNRLTSLDVSPLINLTSLNCSNNQLTLMDVGLLVNLTSLDCSNNQLTAIDVKPLVDLTNLNCSSNQLTTLDLSTLVNLAVVRCSSNQLTVLDLTNQINLASLNCATNNLTMMFVKSTKLVANVNFNFSQNQNIQYICADEKQFADVQSKLDEYGYTNCHINAYCSFVPEGAYNTIKGNCKLDSNNNGCDANDINTSDLKIKINNNTNEASLVNAAGDYVFYTGTGSFILTPQLENPTYFTVSPTDVVVSFSTKKNETKLNDFCITPNGVHSDLEVVMAPIKVARPGFDATYKLVFKNKGNQTLSGSVNLTFDDEKTDFVSAEPVVATIATNTLSWEYANLQPFESRVITVVLNVNSPLENPAVNNGDLLNFITSITPVAEDEMPLDNQFVFNQTVVGSMDPNNVICLEGERVSPSEIGNYLHYVINFENKGTYYAENVVIKIEVDPIKYDINSLQLLNTSFPSYTRITGNVVEFIFKNINLQAVKGDPPVGGHGDVFFEIKSKDSLHDLDKVVKKANIFFDYNAPVLTNDAETTFAALNNAGFQLDASIAVYPNPASSKINVKATTSIKTIDLYDLQGRIIESAIGNNTFIDISKQQKGVYFLKITTEKGSKLEKIIKN